MSNNPEQRLERLKADFPGTLAPYPALCDAILAALRETAMAERERCAGVANEHKRLYSPKNAVDDETFDYFTGAATCAERIADAIRALPDDA